MNEPMKMYVLEWVSDDDEYWGTSSYYEHLTDDGVDTMVVWRNREDAEAFAEAEADHRYEVDKKKYEDAQVARERDLARQSLVKSVLAQAGYSDDGVYVSGRGLPREPVRKVEYKVVEVVVR